MKSPEEIKKYIQEQMASMLTRPMMYAVSAAALETEYINLLMMLVFIDEFPDVNNLRNEWRGFAHEKMGYKGIFPVAHYLAEDKQINDRDWGELCRLLDKFRLAVERGEIK